jgi:hypothetical protein
MTTITKEVIALLKHRNMTGRQLVLELGVEDEPNLVHCVLTHLKKRKAVIAVGRTVEYTSTGKSRLVSLYAYSEPSKPYKPRAQGKGKKRYYRVDLDKASNKDRYLTMLMKRNPQFLLYAKELGITKAHYG